MYSIEPTDHWRQGDKAYCITGLKKNGRYLLEHGRVYRVVEAKKYDGIMSDGIRLAGMPDKLFSSHRFACLRGRAPLMRQLHERVRHGWYDAYKACADARYVQRPSKESTP